MRLSRRYDLRVGTLPLSILTGVGFIGAGVIIRRDNIVVGVTAATLWYVTVIGLCLGGGQIKLGVTATAIGLLRFEAGDRCRR
jgi:putative Mg2+ transporter-C (MgtC) family protein